MESILYFAYGSNMLRERLLARCPSSTLVGTANLPGYSLSFRKPSTDGSGKATLQSAARATVPGVVWQVAMGELPGLDDLEGMSRGYSREKVKLTGEAGITLMAEMYVASRTSSELKPYNWYLALVIAGATQQRLPQAWVRDLTLVDSLPDPMPRRRTRLEALAILRSAGFQELADAIDA